MSPFIVGLTGGIASGKTLVADAFIALGAPLLDADQVARDVVVPGEPALQEIAQTFGAEFLQADGTLDRRRLRERVFGDPAALKQLEAITHPRIRQRMHDWLAAQTAPYSILAVAILIEQPRMRQLVNRVLLIDVPVETQMARLTARDNIDQTLARQMIAAQTSRERRLQEADDIITNDGSPEQAYAAVRRLHDAYLAQARGPR